MTNPTIWYQGNEVDRTIGNWLLVSDVATDSGADRWRIVNAAMNLPDRCLLKVTEVHSKFFNGDWNQLNSTFRIHELTGLNWDHNEFKWILPKPLENKTGTTPVKLHGVHGA